MSGKKGMPRTRGPVCGAHKPAGGTCGNPAGKGTDHKGYGQCHRHGGCTPNGKRNAEKHMALEEQAAQEAAIDRAAREYGVSVETTAEEALLHALARAIGIERFWRERVLDLNPDQMTYGTERITRTTRPMLGGTPTAPAVMVDDTTVIKSVVSVWVLQHEKAEKHLLAVAAKVAELNIERRYLTMAQQQGDDMWAMFQMMVEKLGIEKDDPRLPVVIGEVLQEFGGEA